MKTDKRTGSRIVNKLCNRWGKQLQCFNVAYGLGLSALFNPTIPSFLSSKIGLSAWKKLDHTHAHWYLMRNGGRNGKAES